MRQAFLDFLTSVIVMKLLRPADFAYAIAYPKADL